MFGKLLALPFRLANVPFRAFEKVVASANLQDDIPEGERILSMPLEKIAKAVEEIDE